MKKINLLFTLIASVLILSCGNGQNSAAADENAVMVNVDAPAFKELIAQEGTVLDVRTPEEWAEGTIEGAVKINYYDKDFAQQIEKLDKTKPIFVYCKAGGRSSSAAKKLKDSGFKKIYDLDGGFDSWDDHGYKKVKE